MRSLEEEIARHLQEMAESGELSRVEGYGKPIPEDAGWNATPEALRMPRRRRASGRQQLVNAPMTSARLPIRCVPFP